VNPATNATLDETRGTATPGQALDSFPLRRSDVTRTVPGRSCDASASDSLRQLQASTAAIPALARRRSFAPLACSGLQLFRTGQLRGHPRCAMHGLEARAAHRC